MAYVTGAWYPLVDLLAAVPPGRCEYCATASPARSTKTTVRTQPKGATE